MTKVEGYIEQIIFRNDENGYTVLTLIHEGEEITCVGSLGQINEGEYLEAEVEMNFHPTYGEQYQVKRYALTMPKNVKAIEKYLSSGIIKGIGPSLAKKIVDQFKQKTFQIIEEEPERLVEIKGISERKAQDIAEIFEEKREMRQAMLFLQEYGISNTYAVKIYQQYGEELYHIIKTNPYKLAEDIAGIGFGMADGIAERVGIALNSEFRMKSGIQFLLAQASMEGHTYLPKKQLIKNAENLLGVSVQEVKHIFLDMQVNKQIMQKKINDEDVVYSLSYYYMELSIARKLYDLNMQYEVEASYLTKKIEEIEIETKIKLDEIQKQAIDEAARNGILVITGGPGTGKTTTINAIIKYFEAEGLEILLAAPTGRAAKRMTETTGYEAKTIHRLLEINFNSNEEDTIQSRLFFEKNEDNPLEVDVLIVDEMSMVDITIMHYLLKAIMPGTRLIMVGDVDQLPSVGPGNILKDIIYSNQLRVVKLTRIFRQASKSDIVINAHKINSGDLIELNNKSKDFFFIKRTTSDQITNELTTLIKTRLPKFTGFNVFNGLQVLTPMRKGLLGIEQLNTIIQEVVNPESKKKQEKTYRQVTFREGDKVMQTKNNYQLIWQIKNKVGYIIEEGTGVFNGDVGTIQTINHYTEKVTVQFEDQKKVDYDFNQLDEIELAYAVTIHKSQGSEYPVVILPLLTGPRMLLNRNLLYTAITRAKKYVIIVGSENTLYTMIQNEREIDRYSSLQLRIQEIFNLE